VKKILFDIVDGTKMYFDDLTGINNPVVQDDESLNRLAKAAMKVDDQIVSYELVDV
jgi:hypothetical protein